MIDTTDEDRTPGTSDPAPGAKRRALDAEQAHLDRVHDRVDELRRRATARRADAEADRSGSTFQAIFERDVTAHHHAVRAARFTFGDVESLAFGRLDLSDGDRFHVGRLSVVDEAGEVVLVDWRAPAAAAFYRGTAAQPEGVARRRTLVTRGRQVLDLDDEVLDVEAAAELGLDAVTGQGALLASLSRERSGTMRDIVATIQGDQDRIIRSPATGTLVVAGGPGTGKTVVALHRVAYLLYEDRERFEGRGVLVIGPSQAFTEYTARVLPSLGEDRAVQRPLAGLAPSGVAIRGWDELEVGRVKGDLRMVDVCRRLLAAALPPIPPETRISFDGTAVAVRAGDLEPVRTRLLSRVRTGRGGETYHGRVGGAEQSLRSALWRAWRREHRRGGGAPPEEADGTGFDDMLDDSAQVTMLRRCFWPELRAEEVLGRLASAEVGLVDVADDLFEPGELVRVQGAWERSDDWTVDDVGLLDEVDALLGPAPKSRRERSSRADDPGIRLSADELVTEVEPVDVEAADYRDFAHVVVDEAQDLSPMQWRAVARRAPYASWTVVGDLAQRSRVAEPRTWEDVAELIGRRRVEIARLHVNYRTPAEISELATEVLEAAGHDPRSAPRSVRSTGERPGLLRTDDPKRAAVGLVRTLLRRRDGTLAVVAPDELVEDLRGLLATALAETEHERVVVHDPRTVKGLEFDDVVVVEPDLIASGSEVGTHQLYVAVTRATRSLSMIVRHGREVVGADRCVELDPAPAPQA